jgi:hypothetical protein
MFQTLGGGPPTILIPRPGRSLHELAVSIDPGSVLAHSNERRTRPLGSSFLVKRGRLTSSRAEPIDQKISIRRATIDL